MTGGGGIGAGIGSGATGGGTQPRSATGVDRTGRTGGAGGTATKGGGTVSARPEFGVPGDGTLGDGMVGGT
jgi:hypothetical protein